MQAYVLVLNTICLLIIAVTMLVRANDLRWKRGLSWRWNARLLGLMLSGFSPVGIALYGIFFPMDSGVVYLHAIFFSGLSLVFITTPGLPPWIQLIFKGDQGFEQAPQHYARRTDRS